jgi:DNA-binding XRE family transcriptional regulator
MHSLPPHRKPILTNRLWRYRKQQQLSQRQVAALLHHQRTTQVSRWENGEKLPTLANALKLGCILKTPVETLFPDLTADMRKTIDAQSRPTPAPTPHPNEKDHHSKP